MTAHGAFHWNELMTHDAEKAKAYYGACLGWTFDEMPMPEGTYHIAKSGDQVVGGIFPMIGPGFAGMPDQWFSYIAVDDLAKALAAARAKGGQVMREPFEVPGVGLIAIVADPGGAAQGWMTPAPMPGA